MNRKDVIDGNLIEPKPPVIHRMSKQLKKWILYNVMRSFWVVYIPKFSGGVSQKKDMYLSIDMGWTTNIMEAKRFWKYKNTINIWTKSKKIIV